MSKSHVSLTYAKVTITVAAVAAVLAVALIAAAPAHADCSPANIVGTAGDDRLCGTAGPNVINGLAGNDNIDGGPGNDILTGGPGFDKFSGDAGNDRLRARDGEVDNPLSFCGSGTDSLDIDLADAAFAALAFGVLVPAFATSSCENVTVGAINEGPNASISRRSVAVGEDGRAKVRLNCPASLPAPCAGTLRIGSSEKRLGAPKAYSIDEGKKENVSARLSQRDRNKLSQRGQITARALSVEQGQFGDKTTVQTIKLIAQD
jgi:hypothetical protein